MTSLYKWHLKCFTIFTILLFFVNYNFGQTLVKGVVTDADTGQPLIGAVLLLEDSKSSTTTDASGAYSLIVPFNPALRYQLLTVQYVGYTSQEDFVPVNTADSIYVFNKDFKLKTNFVVLDDIIVTANKVEEELQDVPVAASVINTQNLINRTVSNTSEALESVPNLVMDSYLPHQPTISLRGLATNFANSGVENEIGLYIDDVYYPRSFSFNSTIMDIERVEVLRGPQGTLFGKNTIGGVLHIISEEPKMANSGAVEISAGNFAFLQARAKVNTMLIKDKLALRLSGAYKSRNGWLREENPQAAEVNGINFFGGRASLLYTPTDKVKITVKGNYIQDNSADFTVDYATLPRDTVLGFDRLERIGPNAQSIEDKDGNNRVVNQNAEDILFNRKTYGAVGRMDIKLGNNHTLTSITAYNGSNSIHFRDFDVTPLDASIFQRVADFTTFSQELRISTPREGKKFFYVAGLYYLQEEVLNNDSIAFHKDFLPVFEKVSRPSFLDGLGIKREEIQNIEEYEESMIANSIATAKSYAAFGAVSVEVSERVRINAGLRVTSEARQLQYWQDVYSHTGGVPGLVTLFADTVGTQEKPRTYEISGSDAFALSGNFGMDFKTTEKVLLYINISRGFKGAGFNIAFNRFPSDDTFIFKPEFLNSYEFGLKMKINNRFRFNSAAFVTDYRNKQEAVAVGSGVIIANAESAQGIGLESEFTGVWFEGFRTDIALGIMRLQYFDFEVPNPTNPTELVNLSGNQLFKAPNFTFKFSPEYKTDLGTDLKLLFRLDYNFVGKTFNDIYNTEVLARQPAGLLNGRIAFSTQDEKYTLALWGKNLTEETYIQHAWAFVHGGHISVNPPRTLGVELRVNFY